MAWKAFLLYAVIINLVAFIMMAVDKERARQHKWRIPEGSLFLAGFVGGSVGAYLGMNLCHHKTKKWYFVYGLPVFMFFHAIFLVLWFISRLLPR